MSENNWVEIGSVIGNTGVDICDVSDLTDIKCTFTFPIDTTKNVEFTILADDVNDYYTRLTQYHEDFVAYENAVITWIKEGKKGPKPIKPATLIEPERNWGKYGTNVQPPYMQFDVDIIKYVPSVSDTASESEEVPYRYMVKLQKCTTALDDVTMSTHVTYYKDARLTDDNLV
jgi:hypothetical protein